MDILCYNCGVKASHLCKICLRCFCSKSCENSDEKHKPSCRPLPQFPGDQKETFKIPVYRKIPHMFLPHPGGVLPFNAHDLSKKEVWDKLGVPPNKLFENLVIIRADQFIQVMRSFTEEQQFKIVILSMKSPGDCLKLKG